MAAVTTYFCCWLGVFLLIKHLLLAEYQIVFTDFTVALVGALILAKVVLVLEYVPLGTWVQARPAWVDVVLRTFLYVFGVFVVLVIEHAFEMRHESGGFTAALSGMFRHVDLYHVLLNTLCLTLALLSYNMLSVIRRRLGKGALLRMFQQPVNARAVMK